jgi:hypothetical protein
MLTIEQLKTTLKTVESSYKNNKEFYNINFSILLLYLRPYLFFSSVIVLSIYKLYNILKIDFEFDLSINKIDDTIKINCNKMEFDTKIENKTFLMDEKVDEKTD